MSPDGLMAAGFTFGPYSVGNFGRLRLMSGHANFVNPRDGAPGLICGVHTIQHKAGLELVAKNALPHPSPVTSGPHYRRIAHRSGQPY